MNSGRFTNQRALPGMLSHATARDWLIPYADGMLASDERRRVDGHIIGCRDCSAELRQVRELNLLLVSLPPAPPVAFAPFWVRLQAVLPQRRSFHVRRLGTYRRLGLALATASLAALALTGTALAAPGAMPDSPLYPVKQLEESLQLATTPPSGLLGVQIAQANERLREALIMSENQKPLLAAQSLRAFQVTMNDAVASLKKADPRVAKQDEDRLQAGLAAVERENALKDDDDPDVHRLIASSVTDLDQIEQPDTAMPASPLIVVGTEATPDATATPKPVIKTSPRPQPSDDDRR